MSDSAPERPADEAQTNVEQVTEVATEAAEATPSEPTPPAEATPAAEQKPVDEAAPTGEPAGETAGEEGDDRPGHRIRIGTQRPEDAESKPKAQATAPPAMLDPEVAARQREEAPAPTGKIYPPPNVRDRLSADLEQELEAALEGQSLDDIISSKEANEPGELPEGTRLMGRVAKVYQDNVFVDLGGRNQGVVAFKQFEGRDLPEPGSELDVTVVKLGDDGLYEITLPGGAVDVGNWEDVEEGQVIEVTVTGVNKGGLECQVSGLRGFMPMGQISIYRTENAEEYVGQKLNAVVTEANPERRNLVLSHRAVMEREKSEKRDQLLKELAPGQMREGIVRSLRDFGAFVDLGGVDGLIHVSKMSWDRVNHPSEVLSEGQTVKVKIDKIDPQTGKIGLSYRESAENPWDKAESTYYTGATVEGSVSKIMDFGAFVKLEPGVEGLIHISELAHGRVFRTSDVVSEGQAVQVKVLSFDREKQRIGLSLKALMEAPKRKGEEESAETDFAPPPDAPKAPRKHDGKLKGGIGRPSGGEQFGLKW
ncbi:30S ribosomal protein S1 [Aeoliella mucimassa]|uniref:S1 motif domain-containing protein n=1 Tax=Aeoliella mucimassa TaxID=2527972 RepID=A0A518AHJ7_9BACT|nr:S1 RNA-binding domain-containing protein [Aeoliella mucimassa]QDU54206.1 hypothetical protein Pan181_03860 [Aeoliella mucimassa]